MPSSNSFFSFLAATIVFATAAATVSAQTPLPPPQFTAILMGQVNGTAHLSTTGPFGTRVHSEASGGDLLNATTGEVVGSVLSFADNGVTTASGVSFPSGVMPVTWSDGHFASVSLNGVRDDTQTAPLDLQYAHVETDSPTFSWMNGQFFLLQFDPTGNPAARGFTIYQETSSGAPASSS